jgi:amidase
MAGADPRDPGCVPSNPSEFRGTLERSFRGTRVAWWPFAGHRLAGEDAMPVDARVIDVLSRQRRVFESLGCIVEDAYPDLRGADEAFHVLRALGFVQRYAGLLAKHRDRMKDTVVWNIEQGLATDLPRVARAMNLRSQIFGRMREFMQRYDFLCMPVNQVPPFPVSQPYVDEIAGVKLANYIDWMKSCYCITVTSHPAISVPAGFTGDVPPLPVGLQIVGRHRDDFGVLQMAHAFERETRFARRRPPMLQPAPG